MRTELANQAKGDEQSEFERLALLHLDALYRTALRMTRHAADAEELVQDTCLRAYRFFHRFRPGSSFRAWIFRVMRNLFITQYRRRQRKPRTVSLDAVAHGADGPDGEPPMTGQIAPFRTRHDEAMSRRLEDALEQLPEDSRVAVILAYVEGFRYREIAEIMHWPIGTVMSRLHRSRRMLQQAMGFPGPSRRSVPPRPAIRSIPRSSSADAERAVSRRCLRAP